MEKDTKDILSELQAGDYKYGFVTDIETETIVVVCRRMSFA